LNPSPPTFSVQTVSPQEMVAPTGSFVGQASLKPVQVVSAPSPLHSPTSARLTSGVADAVVGGALVVSDGVGATLSDVVAAADVGVVAGVVAVVLSDAVDVPGSVNTSR
jgi:hypothetical protein